MATVEGTKGAVKIGGVTIGYLTNVEYTVETEVTEQGPYIGNPNKTKVRAGIGVSGSAEGVVTNPLDAGQTAVKAAIDDGTDVELIIEVDDPVVETLTIAAAIITTQTGGLDATEGAPFSFEFEDNGGYTRT